MTKARYLALSLGWALAAVCSYLLFRWLEPDADPKVLPLIAAVLVFAVGMAVTERALLRPAALSPGSPGRR